MDNFYQQLRSREVKSQLKMQDLKSCQFQKINLRAVCKTITQQFGTQSYTPSVS